MVNAARSALGWSQVAWGAVLPAGMPEPAFAGVISAAHLSAVRYRLDEALQALGVAPRSYTTANPSQQIIRAVHVTQIQERVQ